MRDSGPIMRSIRCGIRPQYLLPVIWAISGTVSSCEEVPTRDMRGQPIVDVVVVGKAMHQHDRGIVSRALFAIFQAAAYCCSAGFGRSHAGTEK